MAQPARPAYIGTIHATSPDAWQSGFQTNWDHLCVRPVLAQQFGGAAANTSSEQFRAEYHAALDSPMIVARSDGDAKGALADFRLALKETPGDSFMTADLAETELSAGDCAQSDKRRPGRFHRLSELLGDRLPE